MEEMGEKMKYPGECPDMTFSKSIAVALQIPHTPNTVIVLHKPIGKCLSITRSGPICSGWAQAKGKFMDGTDSYPSAASLHDPNI